MEKFPTLAVCYGAQLIAQEMGGLVSASNIREYGRANLFLKEKNSVLFDGISNNTQVWMSHSDTIKKLPDNSLLLASSDDYIIDGHHRWLAALNSGDPVRILRANVDGNELLSLTLKFPRVYFKDIYTENEEMDIIAKAEKVCTRGS